MIFNATPWYNEPGREFHLDDHRSGSYNVMVWNHTLRYATLYWLQSRLCTPSSSKGKHPAGDAPQDSWAVAPAAAPAASATQAPANPTTASDDDDPWSLHNLPDALVAWETDSSDDIAGPSFQHTMASSSQSAPPSLMSPSPEHAQAQHTGTQHQMQLAKKHGAMTTSALEQAPLTNLHPPLTQPLTDRKSTRLNSSHGE